jgi:tyrosyl-tRNA synthetase
MPVAEIAWEGETMKLIKVMVAARVASSNSDARRLIQQGGVEVDQKPVKDDQTEIPAAAPFVLRVGKKRFVKIVPKK